jgi:hypothetical protein
MKMSNPEVCRECEYNIVDDAVLCSDCAEHGYLDLMRSHAMRRWETYAGDYYYQYIVDLDKHSSDLFEAWVEGNPEKAGKLLFNLFDHGLEEYRVDGD